MVGKLRALAIGTKINAQAEYIVSLAARGLRLKVSVPAGSHRRSSA